MSKFVNLRIVDDSLGFEALLLQNSPDHECIDYLEYGSDGYAEITKWAQIGNLKNVAIGIKVTHNGILYSEERDAFIEFNHKDVTFDFRVVKCFGRALGEYFNNMLDQADTFIIEEDEYSEIIDGAEQIRCISDRITVKRKLLSSF